MPAAPAMVLLGQDLRAEGYIAAYAARGCRLEPAAPPRCVAAALADPRTAGRGRDRRRRDGVVALVDEALAEGLTALQVSNEGLLPGLEEVGRRFGAGPSSCPRSCSRPKPCRPPSPASRRRWPANRPQPRPDPDGHRRGGHPRHRQEYRLHPAGEPRLRGHRSRQERLGRAHPRRGPGSTGSMPSACRR